MSNKNVESKYIEYEDIEDELFDLVRRDPDPLKGLYSHVKGNSTEHTTIINPSPPLRGLKDTCLLPLQIYVCVYIPMRQPCG